MAAICPECKAEWPQFRPFCERCGTALTPETTPAIPLPGNTPPPASHRPGGSSIQLEAQLVNSLLNVFVNRPGLQVELREGYLGVRQGALDLRLDPVEIKNAARFRLAGGTAAPLTVSIDGLELGANGLDLRLRLDV